MVTNAVYCISVMILLFFDTGCASNCTAEEYSVGWKEEDRVTCYNVTSEMLLDFENTTTTKTLIIDENSVIEKLPSNTSLTKFTELEALFLSSLKIEEILPGAFYGLIKLENLDLHNNRIKDIPQNTFSGLENLKNLYLQGNSLKQISVGVFNNLKSLESLYLSDNLISQIEDNALTGLDNLMELSLNRNNLTVLQDNVFYKLQMLERIDISENPLKEIGSVGFSHNLETIIIDNGLLKEWKVNTSLLTIKYLSLTKNYLSEFDFSTLSATEFYTSAGLSENNISVVHNLENANFSAIDLSNNFLTELKGISKTVRYLRLNNNKIKHLIEKSETEDYSILSLYLSHNEIEAATCLGLSSLEYLYLDNNQITVVKQNSFKGCTKLYGLYLSHNKIEHIDTQAFKNLESLSNLDLSNNKISMFDYTSFAGLNELTSLYFDNNAIDTFDVEEIVKQTPKLERMRFDSASLFCDDLHKIFYSLRVHHIYELGNVHITNIECKKRS